MPARGGARRSGLPPRGKSAAAPARRRFALRDARIRAKLGLILVIPILAIASLTGLRLIDSGKRALAAQALAGEPNAGADFANQVKVTKAATGSYSAHRGRVSRIPAALKDRLDRIDTQLSTLDTLRGQVTSGQGISISEVVVRYGVIIDDMVGYHSEIVQV